MARRLTLEREVVVTGGVAKNQGVIKALEEQIGFPTAVVREDPQIVGAVGAALRAREKEAERETL
jgi:activator of 2-hydroxyglutaryl-CoA dehydratase